MYDIFIPKLIRRRKELGNPVKEPIYILVKEYTYATLIDQFMENIKLFDSRG